MTTHGKGASPETGAPGGCFAGERCGDNSLSNQRAQRLANRYGLRSSLAQTVAALVWEERL